MIAEVISIGDELTSGQRLDTNSQWLSQRLGEIGIPVVYHTTVADDLEANVRVFTQAIDRADVVVASGGLGPTADDLTREALAKATGTELILDEAALEHIRSLFARRKRDMPQRNEVQALFPEGSHVVPNPHGTAPGIDMQVARAGRAPCQVFALPGVPPELFEMWEQTVGPRLALLGSGKVLRHRRIKCFGVGESDLEQMLPDLIRRGRVPSVGITVHQATITLRITATGTTSEECLAAMKPTVATIHECLGELVYGEEDDELEHSVARLLISQGKTLATAEWGSAGLLSEWVGGTSGPGNWFAGGWIVQNERAFVRLVGQAWQDAEQSTGSMARACRETFGVDYGLAIGPFPAFDPQAGEPGRAHFALVCNEGTQIRSSPFAGHPEILKPRAVKQALNLLRLSLIESGRTKSE